jgi:tetracycline 7-halogenase / FADH2 O2-dependent halogenase
VDAFLVGKVKEAGITYLDNTEIKAIDEQDDGSLRIKIDSGHGHQFIECKWIIDATGSPRLASGFFDVKSSADNFETDSWALYSHFKGIKRWNRHIRDDLGYQTNDYPYDPDHSALHHLIDEGWMWNLRFNNELVSAGFVLDRQGQNHIKPDGDKKKLWPFLLSKYPSILSCFMKFRFAGEPGKLIQTGRLQRCMNRVFGRRWIALNHTAGFVDPLHSTGIAHSLTGLERILKIFTTSDINGENMAVQLKQHQSAFFNELHLIDLLVAGCYQARTYFDLFHAYTMVYFAATLSYEQNRLSGHIPSHYLMAGDPAVREVVEESYRDLKEVIRTGASKNQINSYIEQTRKRIAPYNIAGLLDKDKRNMYHHTAVSLNN